MKPIVKMVGEDGNAFAILARCNRAAKIAGWSNDEWKNFHAKATSGNYSNLIATVVENFEVDPTEDDAEEFPRISDEEDE